MFSSRCGLAGDVERSSNVSILPERVELFGEYAQQHVLLEQFEEGEARGEAGQDVKWKVEDATIAEFVNGRIRPLKNGRTQLHAEINGKQAEAEVVVQGMEGDWQWSFQQHVQPVLAKAGCNSGACHGALAGKGGFKLSLRGYDSSADYFAITRQARGRRIEFGDPGRSLMLAKPSGGMPHKGGLRFEVDSPEYEILAGWIASGAPGPTEQDAKVVGLEILPRRRMLQVGDQQRVIVMAEYSDGKRIDVTPFAKFTSTDEAVATVDESGHFKVIGPGEGAVTAWFASRIAVARVVVPFAEQIEDSAFAEFEPQNFVDERVVEQLRRLKLPPSHRADDATFIRRAYVDTIGLLPTSAEVRAFIADDAPDKRQQLVDELLDRPEWVDYWTYKWSDLFLINGRRLRPLAVKSYYEWLRGHVERNTPWDEVAYSLITATGDSFEEGATNFYALHQDPETMTENVTKAFLGLSIGCAKCHNHPLEKWTNDEYYALANFFSRVRGKGWGGDPRNGDGDRTLVVAERGELIQPRTGKPQPPTPLDGEMLAEAWEQDRRVYLAQWLTSAENPYFARTIANRVWANFMGVGLVEPVDDMRVSNPASNEMLLTELEQYLVEHDFNLKALMRLILNSATYQRSSKPLPGNQGDSRFYSRYYPRRMLAEVLHDAIVQVTDVPTSFTEISYSGADTQKTDFYEPGTRALELYDSAVKSYFLKTFGRNDREITCECERSNQPSMVQVLHLANGNTLQEKLAAERGFISRLAQGDQPDYRVIEEVYLSALARYPTDREMESLLRELDDPVLPEERRIVLEDLIWSITNSREFLFQH